MAARKPAPSPSELPVLPFATQAAFARWLARNHQERGVWIKVAKVASGVPSVTHAQALEVALCWGWIDGQRRGHDERFFLQKFCPRTRRSTWSKINRDKALALIAAGKMNPPGLAEVERARQDGRWAAAYDPPSRTTVPDDLAAALARNGKAARFFTTLDAQNRFAILFRIHTAKKPETRARRIAAFVEMLARGEKIY